MTQGKHGSSNRAESIVAAGVCEPITAVPIARASLDQSWWLKPTVTLFDDEFGTGYIEETELRDMASAPESAVFIAHRNNAILVGVSIISYADRDTREHFRQSFASLGFTRAATDGSAVGCLRSVVVAPSVRGHGIGNRLIHECVEVGRHQRWTALYTASWVSGLHHQSAGILDGNGFTVAGQIADYWFHDTTSGMSCVVCGSPCRCEALIMRRPLIQ